MRVRKAVCIEKCPHGLGGVVGISSSEVSRAYPTETPCGSVHESPMRHLPHAPKRKAGKTKLRDWVSARQRFEPNLELPPLRIPAMCYWLERMTDKTIRRSGSHFYADDK